MLNRRYLRVKVMQALYAYHQWEDKDIAHFEKEMIKSTEKIYDLYLLMLMLFVEIRDVAASFLEDSKSKMLPSQEDLNPNTKFVNNRFIEQLAINRTIQREAASRKLSWQDSPDVSKKIFYMIRSTREYYEYMRSFEDSYEMDRNLMLYLFKRYISEFEMLESYFEEKSIYWVDDLGLVCSCVIKTIDSFHENSGAEANLLPLYKDLEEDKAFMIDLFHKCILHDKEHLDFIAGKTKNWEVDRIAMMDVLLMKMALTELLYFPTIPIKVTLNEYIEISKYYSTPKSKIFINGILDKLVVDLKMEGRIQKAGRGLVE